MRTTTTTALTTLSTLLSLAAANPHKNFPTSLFARQAATSTSTFTATAAATVITGLTPQQESCHADCGYCIKDAQTQGAPAYCTNGTWLGLLAGCENCANTADIWPMYSAGVQSAVAPCSISVSLAPSSSAVETLAASASAVPSSAAASTITASASVVPSGAAASTITASASVVSGGTTSAGSSATTVRSTSTKSSAAEATRGALGLGMVVAAAALGGVML